MSHVCVGRLAGKPDKWLMLSMVIRIASLTSTFSATPPRISNGTCRLTHPDGSRVAGLGVGNMLAALVFQYPEAKLLLTLNVFFAVCPMPTLIVSFSPIGHAGLVRSVTACL